MTMMKGAPGDIAAPPTFSNRSCTHCGTTLAPGQGAFCCTGCEGAHALVRGLGLEAFYQRQRLALRAKLAKRLARHDAA